MAPTDDHPDDGARVRNLTLRELVARGVPLVRPHAGAFGLGVLLLLVSVTADLAGPLVLKHLIDTDIGLAVADGGTGGSRSGIVRSAALYAGLFLVGTLANYLQVVVLTKMGLSIVTRLKREVFHHVLGLSMEFFDRNSPGRLLARVESDSERLQALFSDVAVSVLRTLVLLVGALAVMFSTDWRVTLAVVCVALPVAIGTVAWFRWMRGLYKNVRAMVARITAYVSEYVQGVPVIQAFGYERRALDRLGALNRDKMTTERRAQFYEYGLWGFLNSIEVFAVLFLLCLASGRLLGLAMTVGTLVLFVEYTRRIFRPLAEFSEQLGGIQRAFASADRVFSVLDTPSRTPDPKPSAAAELPATWNEVAFEDVSFVYDGGARAVDGVTFRIRRGERVALVGLSGGGKTTLTNLLLRFYDPTSGRITVDGRDLRAFPQRAWRARIGLVLQDIHLFPGTVGENLRALADDVDDRDILRAARTVGADEVIARLPKGLDEPLTEGGANLSMGERQLLSFARALVHDPDLLVLDEATSSVDPGTERRLQASMDRLLAGRTSLVIAHRLATVVSADRILVMHGGRLVEEGSHAELHAKGGIYRDLFDLQFKSGAVA
ncbi:MAG: ABC transporter ATP-binding protein/permease [Planctomycetes bacterium]|nr:ABC transporter ATP-binding protein/permease [Planctomycetota bacterium]